LVGQVQFTRPEADRIEHRGEDLVLLPQTRDGTSRRNQRLLDVALVVGLQ
jgi:hypothetical protein